MLTNSMAMEPGGSIPHSQGLGSLGVQYSWVQTRVRSMDFFQDVKILSNIPPGGTLSRGPRV